MIILKYPFDILFKLTVDIPIVTGVSLRGPPSSGEHRAAVTAGYHQLTHKQLKKKIITGENDSMEVKNNSNPI